jgi:spermidine synthase
LTIDGVFQTVTPASSLHLPKGMLLRGGDHVELIPYFRPEARSALVIGLGGGLQTRSLELYGLEVTAVDIEPEVVRLAKKYFQVTCETVVADGRTFLQNTGRLYDAIVLDVFVGTTPPEHLFTRQAFECVAERLSPRGIFVVHLLGAPDHPAIRAVARTLAVVFPEWRATRSSVGGALESTYLFASPHRLTLGSWVRAEVGRLGLPRDALTDIDVSDGRILTDAGSGLSELTADISEEHRRASLEIQRSPPW